MRVGMKAGMVRSLLELLVLSRTLLALRPVLVYNQTLPVLVRSGRTVVMSCRTSSPWFFCLWDTPGTEDMECAIQYDQPERICSQNNRTKLIGQREACNVQFEVRYKDLMTLTFSPGRPRERPTECGCV